MNKKPEKLYTPREFSELNSMGIKDVRLLLKSGVIRGKRMIVRGKGTRPRLRIPESEIVRYQENMPPATGDVPAVQSGRRAKAAKAPTATPRTMRTPHRSNARESTFFPK